MRKPLIGIPADRRLLGNHWFHCIGEKYIRAVAEAAGATPVLVPSLGGEHDLDWIVERCDGVLLTGPRWTAQEAGAHVADRAAGSTPNAAWFNQHSIGICLVGNGERREFTDAQLKTLARVVEDLQAACGIPDSAVFLHSDLAPVASPGRWFPRAQLALELSN